MMESIVWEKFIMFDLVGVTNVEMIACFLDMNAVYYCPFD